jgi:hypothetical protein
MLQACRVPSLIHSSLLVDIAWRGALLTHRVGETNVMETPVESAIGSHVQFGVSPFNYGTDTNHKPIQSWCDRTRGFLDTLPHMWSEGTAYLIQLLEPVG